MNSISDQEFKFSKNGSTIKIYIESASKNNSRKISFSTSKSMLEDITRLKGPDTIPKGVQTNTDAKFTFNDLFAVVLCDSVD